MAATMLAAWALNPPMLPAMAEPTRFLLMFSSTSSVVLLFNTCTHRSVDLHVGVSLYDPSGFILVFPYLPDHLRWNGCLADHGLSSSGDPVYGSGLLVGAVVAADGQDLHFGVVLLEPTQALLSPLTKTALTALQTEKEQSLHRPKQKTPYL